MPSILNYQVIECIHKSDKGSIVLSVIDKKSKNNYVLKLIGPLSDRISNLVFKREIEALKKLNKYDDIVHIFDNQTGITYDNRKSLGAILLEYVSGNTLANTDTGVLSGIKKLELCLRISNAISYAHKNDILHRDIQPDNIIYYKGNIKLIDFGSSKIKSIVERESVLPFITPNYTAPEIITGGEATEASDIYSLGAVFYRVLFNEEPTPYAHIVENISKSHLNEKLKSMLLGMLNENPVNRVPNADIIVSILAEIIQDLNINEYSYYFNIDSNKLDALKNSNFIQETMTMPQFTSYLGNAFRISYGFLKKDKFVFICKNLFIETHFDKESGMFKIINIYDITIDRYYRYQKIYMRIEGTLKFYDVRYLTQAPSNGNVYLKNQILNYMVVHNSKESKEAKFNELFGKWLLSLHESINNTKEANGRIIYKQYYIEDDKLILTLDSYVNNTVDNLSPEIRYIFDDFVNDRHMIYPVGYYLETTLDGNDTQIRISLDPKARIGKLREFLNQKRDLHEDYNYKIKSYRRQLYAITALKDDNYSSRNLKDIILDMEEPIYTPPIKTLSFSSNLNNSQQKAVEKAIYGEGISLIQGPPGTGKTKVIIEILDKLIFGNDNNSILPHILVVSQSNIPVDNIIENLSNNPKWNKVRIIRIVNNNNLKSTKEIVSQFSLPAVRVKTFEALNRKAREFLEEKLQKIMEQENDQSNEIKEKWLKIQEIQEDWLRRCGNYESFDYQLINSASIIAGTCIGFLSNDYIKDMYFDYVIVDEAAKAATPELLVSIIKAKKIILVGDQNQLPPYTNEKISPLSKELNGNPDYRLFDILIKILPDTHTVLLDTQYRMIRNIGDMISNIFYEGKIVTDIDDSERQHGISFLKDVSIIWYSTSKLKNHDEISDINNSFLNLAEAKSIKNIVSQVNNRDNFIDIGIITGYNAQKNVLKRMIDNSEFKNIKQINIDTVDGYQGKENNIIIYSTVRTKKTIGFQKEKERINVAFSRAKCLLIIVGDLDFFYNWDMDQNKYVDVIDYIKSHPKSCIIQEL